MALTPTTAPRWVSWASASASAWAMRSLPRLRPASPGWPPDSTPAAMITSLLAFAAGGALAAWTLHHGDTSTGRPRSTRTSAVLVLSLLTLVGWVVAWTTTSTPADRIGTLVALAAFALGLLVGATRSTASAGAATSSWSVSGSVWAPSPS